jgi:Ca2+-binding RTX toxin-like protein
MVVMRNSSSSVLLSDNFNTENNGFGKFDYSNLTNWNVTDGTVDLIGNGYFDVLEGNGLYLDLDGTTFKAGRLESKSSFNFSPGDQVVLSFSLAGSQRDGKNSVDVSLGNLYRESFELSGTEPFRKITRSFTVTSITSGRLVFDHEKEGSNNLGLLLDNVELSVSRPTSPTESIKIRGTDAIFLAGRTDVAIPLLGQSSSTFPLKRHGFVGSDFLQETFPQSIAVQAGQSFTFEATGKVDFFNGTSTSRAFGPDGGNPDGSTLLSIQGISGYQGPEGALVGVFLTDKNPSGEVAPETLNFTSSGLGNAFSSLAPKIGQVFLIGDGYAGNGNGGLQRFVAPSGATRLFVGTVDGFFFDGQPGAYEDNDGAYEVVISNPIIGTNNNNSLLGGPNADLILGLRGDDNLTGYDGNDTLVGGYGDDTLSGGSGSDSFVFDMERRFDRRRIGIDKILDFQSPDKIVLDKTTFIELKDRPFTFATVDSAEQAASNSALFTYIRSTGALYYNQNGSSSGFGRSSIRGGQFAELAGGLTLTASDFVIRA